MWVIDLDKNVIHDLSRSQYQCKLAKVPKERRKKIYTMDGVKRYMEDPLNPHTEGCEFCMPELYQHDMNAIFK